MVDNPRPNHQTSVDERNGEIWSTRIQQELLALTTDGGDIEATAEARSILPNFVTLQDHALDLVQGTCMVSVEAHVKLKRVTEEANQTDESTHSILLAMEASLKQNGDGTPNTKDPSYPFVAPVARLSKGMEFFPTGSTIQNGDRIVMDLDWTPSLHLADAILNVSLKIKESILQGEPFHPDQSAELSQFDEMSKSVDEVAKGARRLATSLSQRAAMFGKNLSSPKKQQQGSMSGGERSKKRSPRVSPSISGEVVIDEEINLLEEPWVNARGVYYCKAIRRPAFVEDIMSKATGFSAEKEKETISSPSAMFRSLAQSARSVMEESLLMVTETHIIELKASKLNMQIGKVVFCIPIELMAKLKFRRQESLSLFFKTAPEDPLIYACPDSSDAVKQIQGVLKKKGVRGKHTNAAAYRAISEAMQIVQDIQTKEMAIEHEPTVQRVNEIMDLYRQAAERFEIAGDIRHEEVVTHMRKFLAKPTTVSILDGSYSKHADASPLKSSKRLVLEGEVLEASDALLNYEEESEGILGLSAASPSSDKDFESNIESLLNDVKADFQNFDFDDDDIDAGISSHTRADDGIEDMAADLDAMMKEADKELEDLMSS